MVFTCPEDALESIRRTLTAQELQIEELSEENRRLRESTCLEEELEELRRERNAIAKQLDELRKAAYRGFPITGEQERAITDWRTSHESSAHAGIPAHLFHGTSGGTYSYKFIPTSLGTIGYITCGQCGEKFCFQELD